jgi:hypothetical protein
LPEEERSIHDTLEQHGIRWYPQIRHIPESVWVWRGRVSYCTRCTPFRNSENMRIDVKTNKVKGWVLCVYKAIF